MPIRGAILMGVSLVALAIWALHAAEQPKSTQTNSPTQTTVANASQPQTGLKNVQKISEFPLRDPRTNKPIVLARATTVVLFLGTECPVSNAFLPEVSRLHQEYKDKGVTFLAVNPNAQDDDAKVAAHARRFELPFPVVSDPHQKLADLLGAKRTPEAFVLDKKHHIVYQGRVDDQFGIGYKRAGKPTRRDLAEALDEVLAEKQVSVARTAAPGCLIGRRQPAKTEGKITFTREISRILQKNCQECHRPGQIGPMALQKYEDVTAWSGMIREVVGDGRMPPWHADPRFSQFSNDRRLSADEKQTLLDWLDGGMARGDERDLPPERKFPEGWKIGTPDVVLRMPKSFRVPAETPKGGVPYQYFVVPTNFAEDKWIQRAEAKPGAPEVVHHIIAFILPPGELFRMDSPGATLCGMAPGEMPMMLPEGQARKVPKGSRILFQMHYTPNGKAQDDISQIGLIFAKQPPRHRVLTLPIHDQLFFHKLRRIPAGAPNHRMECTHTFKEDVRICSFLPHMHLRGKDFEVEAIYPDGKRQTLLKIPRYDFNWQSAYRLAEPVRLPKGSRLRCVAHFDNSANNPNNPDPTINVTWGDQTWEEMMVGWTEYFVEDSEKK